MALPAVLAGALSALRGASVALRASSAINDAFGPAPPRVQIRATVRGLPELKRALNQVSTQLQRKLVRQALRDGARLVQRQAKAAAPVLKLSTYSGASAMRRGVRKAGTLRKAIAVRTSKQAIRRGAIGVFVNVRPAKAGKRGAKSPDDPFYWRWINFGWTPRGSAGVRGASTRIKIRGGAGARPRPKPGVRFLEAGARMLGASLQIIERRLGMDIRKFNDVNARSRE